MKEKQDRTRVQLTVSEWRDGTRSGVDHGFAPVLGIKQDEKSEYIESLTLDER